MADQPQDPSQEVQPIKVPPVPPVAGPPVPQTPSTPAPLKGPAAKISPSTLYTPDGKPHVITDPEVAKQAYLSGALSPLAGSDVGVLNPESGKIENVKAEDLHQALLAGGELATPESYRKQVLENRLGPNAVAGAMATSVANTYGGLRGATAGLSDPLAVELARIAGGGQGAANMAQTLKDLKEYAPIASGAGTVAGLAGSVAVGGGLGAAAKGATTGGAALRGAAALVNPIGEVGSLAAQGAGRLGGGVVARMAAQGAAEGALYNAAQNTSEQLLDQNPGFSGEKVLAAAGHGGFWGGLLGAGLGAASEGIAAIGKGAAPKLAEAAQEQAIQSIKPTKKIAEKINALGKEGFGQFVIDEVAAGKMLATKADMYENAAMALEDSAKKLDGLYSSLDTSKVAAPTASGVTKKIEEYVLEKLSPMKGFNAEATRTAEDLTKKITELNPTDFGTWRKVRQALDGMAKWDSTVSNQTREVYKSVRGLVNEAVFDAATEGKIAGASGTIADALKAENLRYRYARLATDALEGTAASELRGRLPGLGLTDAAGMAGAHMLGGGPVSGLLGAVGNRVVREYGATTMTVTLDKLATLAKLGELSTEAGETLAKVTNSVGSRAATKLDKAFGLDSYNKVADQIQALAANPQMADKYITDSVHPYGEHAPMTQAAMVNTAKTGIQYLNDQLPKPAKSYPIGAPANWELLSDKDKLDFLRKVHTVVNPTQALQKVMSGQAVPAEIATLKAVYPNLLINYGAAAQETIGKTVGSGKGKRGRPAKRAGMAGYQSAVQLGAATGDTLHATLEPSFVSTMQKMREPEPQKGPGRPRGKALSGFADQASTDYSGTKTT